MTPFALFGISTFANLVSAVVVAWIFVWPAVQKAEPQRALAGLVAFHMIRAEGLSFLVPGVVSPLLPAAFATPAAFGDFIAAILATIATIALANRRSWATATVWLFNLWGTADLLLAFYHGNRVGLQPGMLGPAFYIVTALVPVLLVSHFLIFRLLLRGREVH